MGARKGFRPPNAGKGRKKGAVNKFTKSAREAFLFAANAMGGPQALADWAKKNPEKFYPLYARLIPVEHVGEGGEGPVKTTVVHEYQK